VAQKTKQAAKGESNMNPSEGSRRGAMRSFPGQRLGAVYLYTPLRCLQGKDWSNSVFNKPSDQSGRAEIFFLYLFEGSWHDESRLVHMRLGLRENLTFR
jgi:hypothetical protein